MRAEILRLAEKEAKTEITKARKATAQCLKQIAELKRLLTQCEKEIKRLKQQFQAKPFENDQLAGVRFSARSVRAQRRRLGLSAEDYGKLIGVSALAIYNWERGTLHPRRALVAVHGISKRVRRWRS